MKKQQLSDADIEHILQSIDSIERAEPTPFLYTRIRGRLQPAAGPAGSRPWSSLAIAGLALFILVNTYLAAVPFQTDIITDTDPRTSFVEEYDLETTDITYSY